MPCPSRCERECASQDNNGVSPGPIYNNERIARAGFHNKSVNQNSGNIRKSLIDKSGLFASQLSVWRLSARAQMQAENLVDILKARNDLPGELCSILSCRTSDIKAIIDPHSEGRALCVVDECECDQDGNHHPAHAHIALCNIIRSTNIEKTSANFQQIVDDLHLCFIDRLEWVNNKLTREALADEHEGLKLNYVKIT